MAYLADLIAARDSAAGKLAALLALGADKPTYTIGGRSVSWTWYKTSLIANIKDINKLIIQAGGAVEISTAALG